MEAEPGIFGDSEDENEMNPHHSDQEDNDDSGPREDEAEEAPASAADTSKVIKPKRVVKNPLPKLDAVRLMGPRGVGILQSTFRDVKFKGKGHEKEDLTLLMKKLEHWAHRLFPQLPFDDTLKQIEKLGTKKPVQNMMKRIRFDMFQSDEMNGVVEPTDDQEETESKEVVETDVFDELLGTGPFADRPSVLINSQIHSTLTHSSINSSKGNTLTVEQREKMEKNRLLALEKRKAKQSAQPKEHACSEDDFGLPDGELTELSERPAVPTTTSPSPNKENEINSEVSKREGSSNNGLSFDNIDKAETSVSNLNDKEDVTEIVERHSEVTPMEVDTLEIAGSSLGGKNLEGLVRSRSEDETGLGTDPESLINRTVNVDDKNVFTEDDILSYINPDESNS